jgi:transcriptional regulator with XRE-family HTH domain
MYVSTTRRLRQLDLALEAGVSTRHLSFVETGRSRPSEQMVVHLAEQLEVPLRERNRMLLAAGYAPIYSHRPLDELGPIQDALDQLLTSHEPFPAVVVDRAWNVVAANAAIGLLTAGAASHLLEPPINALRLTLHPEGMAPRIENLGQWRAHLLRDLETQVDAYPELAELLEELRVYPSPPTPPGEPGPHEVFLPLGSTG